MVDKIPATNKKKVVGICFFLAAFATAGVKKAKENIPLPPFLPFGKRHIDRIS